MIPEEGSRFFGIYHMDGEHPRNLAMPLYHWGKFYEQLIRTIMNGKWKSDDSHSSTKAGSGNCPHEELSFMHPGIIGADIPMGSI